MKELLFIKIIIDDKIGIIILINKNDIILFLILLYYLVCNVWETHSVPWK